ncbi:MAG: hypothetical protein H0Z40_09325 [Desulfotomaculum sp.]|nr:hypothetical protein [Desulfotomaculum sp.]
MMQVSIITLNQVQNSIAQIEKIVGQNWMEDWVHNIRDNHGRSNQDNIPLLASWWLKASDELGYSQLTGSFVVSESTLRLVRLVSDLQTLVNTTGFNSQLPFLKKDKKSFFHLCCRLNTAAEYVRQGAELTLFTGIDEPDFVLHKPEELAVAVTVPTITNTNQLTSILPPALSASLNRLPNRSGIIFIDLPLPPAYTPGEWISIIKSTLTENTIMPSGVQVYITITYIGNCGTELKIIRNRL